MALTTVDDKLAIMNWCEVWEAGVVIAESSPFDQADKQQLLWGLPDPLWPVLAISNFNFLGSLHPRVTKRPRVRWDVT